MLLSKNAKICITTNMNAKICVTPNTNPYANRWNIGRVGSPMQNSHVGHVDFMLFVSLSLALGSQRKHNFQWNMGFRYLSRFYIKLLSASLYGFDATDHC